MKKLFLIAVAAIAVSCANTPQDKKTENENDSTTVALLDTLAQEVASAVNDPELDAKVEAQIREFYMGYVFGDKYFDADDDARVAIINKYCTPKLAQYLKDSYEYDDADEGARYAIWDFRTGANDSNGEYEIYSVDPLGGGKYKVAFNDGGTKGSCVLTVVTDGDNIKFDEISERQETE